MKHKSIASFALKHHWQEISLLPPTTTLKPLCICLANGLTLIVLSEPEPVTKLSKDKSEWFLKIRKF